MSSGTESYLHDENSLASMASQGGLSAFNQRVLAYQNLAYHHAHALLGDPSLAEDLAQDSFIRAFQNIASFRGGSFRAWIPSILTNSAHDGLHTIEMPSDAASIPRGRVRRSNRISFLAR